MNKKIIALIVNIIIVALIAGVIFVINKQDSNNQTINNLAQNNNTKE